MNATNTDLVIGDDGKARPQWAASNEMLRTYYDTEWGMPVRDEQGVYERLCLEGFQAGLSWQLVLRKRDALREYFHGFDPDRVAEMDSIEPALNDERLIRNRLKLKAVITNARATIALRDDPEVDGDLADFIWSFQPATTPQPQTMDEVPTQSEESHAMAKALKKKGFKFIGPTTCFALMEALGIVDTHLIGSWRRGSSGVWAD
ncbi:DNA-3-methyladenine glycosylase I [Corynebacterium pilosum]|uniref:DNA-3-methyladenine glycosylase I n=1 Tax=Corynebacterium pilosum TaxID=35756 RepID=A0A376CNV3_9CORY|nr:DNA-3-methyladenine glycosylase I [Corynebacterium pilosum]STC69985.1 DNA-3-methyladenine glycosylase I [Corynebacterium pilosum]